ncbi:MAG: hypothetical protein DRN27_08145 [Thermoplasmata archaeon]|nr:MAG: hypothetical protein DRN27_08145 [Thermoplasmata archaeon]
MRIKIRNQTNIKHVFGKTIISTLAILLTLTIAVSYLIIGTTLSMTMNNYNEGLIEFILIPICFMIASFYLWFKDTRPTTKHNIGKIILTAYAILVPIIIIITFIFFDSLLTIPSFSNGIVELIFLPGLLLVGLYFTWA